MRVPARPTRTTGSSTGPDHPADPHSAARPLGPVVPARARGCPLGPGPLGPGVPARTGAARTRGARSDRTSQWPACAVRADTVKGSGGLRSCARHPRTATCRRTATTHAICPAPRRPREVLAPAFALLPYRKRPSGGPDVALPAEAGIQRRAFPMGKQSKASATGTRAGGLRCQGASPWTERGFGGDPRRPLRSGPPVVTLESSAWLAGGLLSRARIGDGGPGNHRSARLRSEAERSVTSRFVRAAVSRFDGP